MDSTLLRFLSSQKGGSLSPPKGFSKKSTANSSLLETTVEEKRSEVEVPTLATGSFTGEEIDVTVTSPIIDPKIVGSQSWLSQYNAQKVALKLQALGVDEQTSLATGKIVQNYVLARVTRRRIRKFLQERDESWEAGNPLPFDRSGMKESMSPSTINNYNLDDVLSVMTEYGLTGIDIAAIFSHTPSVTMMKARTHRVKNEEIKSGKNGFTLVKALDSALVGLLGGTLKLRRYDARKVSTDRMMFFLRCQIYIY